MWTLAKQVGGLAVMVGCPNQPIWYEENCPTQLCGLWNMYYVPS